MQCFEVTEPLAPTSLTSTIIFVNVTFDFEMSVVDADDSKANFLVLMSEETPEAFYLDLD